MKFDELASKALDHERPLILLSIDPGETTGWAIFSGWQLLDHGELRTGTADDAIDRINELIQRVISHTNVKHSTLEVVIEDYMIYAWRAKQHAGSKVLTARIIGMVETLLRLSKVPLSKQMAGLAKGFATDDKLKEWGFWMKGQKHTRDAIRHACYYILFHKRDEK